MLFNSYAFVLAFLPLALLLYHSLRHLQRPRLAFASLVLMSFVFYGWWNVNYIPLLLGLMTITYGIGRLLIRYRGKSRGAAQLLLALGLAINVLALGYFKYANFFIDNINALFGIDFVLSAVILPIGISFFVFQKIAFLVDAYRGNVTHLDPLNFALFVMFFPQLIAGPIVHHSEVMPQFADPKPLRRDYINMGLTIFVLGLGKKIWLADTMATFASPVFDAAAQGRALDFATAWAGALAYTTQLYYDFSAYSEMAVGIALLFGIRLPINFNSPYKANDIIEFWRRWHITLSRFLRDYVYISLGGNRHGKVRRYGNLLATMVIGGFWHGAGWNFVVWGLLHGMYLAVNHAWRDWHTQRKRGAPSGMAMRLVSALLTLLAIVVAWVFFRAADLHTALSMLSSMVGQYDSTTTTSPNELALHATSAPAIINNTLALAYTGALLLFARFAPNTHEWVGYTGVQDTEPPIDAPQHVHRQRRWRATHQWALWMGVLLALDLAGLSTISEFIYFQF